MKNNTVLIEEQANGVSWLYLNDPDRLNAMSEQMATDFAEAVKKLQARTDLRVVVISGKGKAFSSGGALEMLDEKRQKDPAINRQDMLDFYHKFLSLRAIAVPVIAAINGAAVGAGCGVALACDVRVASESASFSVPFISLGLHPGMGTTYFLPRLVGAEKAAELFFSGRKITAEEACACGMISQVVKESNFLTTVTMLATQIAQAPVETLKSIKQTLRRALEKNFEEALANEASAQALSYSSKEFAEGLAAARRELQK